MVQSMLDSFLTTECVHPFQSTLGTFTTAVSEVSEPEVFIAVVFVALAFVVLVVFVDIVFLVLVVFVVLVSVALVYLDIVYLDIVFVALVAFVDLAFVADVAEPQASVDIALAFDVLVPVSVVAVEVDSSGCPKFLAFPNVDYYASSSSSVEVLG
jgi:hypothetical protein